MCSNSVRFYLSYCQRYRVVAVSHQWNFCQFTERRTLREILISKHLSMTLCEQRFSNEVRCWIRCWNEKKQMLLYYSFHLCASVRVWEFSNKIANKFHLYMYAKTYEVMTLAIWVHKRQSIAQCDNIGEIYFSRRIKHVHISINLRRPADAHIQIPFICRVHVNSVQYHIGF